MARLSRITIAAAALASVFSLSDARADETSDRAARWKDLRQTIFGDRALEADHLVNLEAPVRAMEAAIVPVTLSMPADAKVTGEWLVIDENPSPLAAHFSFGPAMDPHAISMRVRVDAYTNFHAVAETADGKLHETERYVKAAGGCSAPVGMSDDEAMQGVGNMRLKVRGAVMPGHAVPVTLMIWHPNFNGMQMNPVTRTYTPARYIRTIDVSYNGKLAFHMDGDISISSNPVIDFALLPALTGSVKIVATDSAQGRWERTFPLPAQTN